MPTCNEHKNIVDANNKLIETSTKVLVSLENLKGEVALLNQKFDASIDGFNKHMEEAAATRPQIHDNTKFRKMACWAIGVLYVAGIGAFIRSLF